MHRKPPPINRKYNSQDDVVRALKESIESLGHTPSLNEYNQLNLKPRISTMRRFGLSWRETMRLAGHEVLEVNFLSKEEIRKELIEYSDLCDGVLNFSVYEKEYKEKGLPSPTAILNCFGSWLVAAKEIGAVTVNQRWYCTEGELLEHLQQYHKEFDETPNMRAWKEYAQPRGLPGKSVFQRVFGSWNNAIEKAGLKPNTLATKKWTQDGVMQALRENFVEIPDRKEYLEFKKGKKYLPSTTIIAQLFGSFYEGFKTAGVSGEKKKTGRPKSCR